MAETVTALHVARQLRRAVPLLKFADLDGDELSAGFTIQDGDDQFRVNVFRLVRGRVIAEGLPVEASPNLNDPAEMDAIESEIAEMDSGDVLEIAGSEFSTVYDPVTAPLPSHHVRQEGGELDLSPSAREPEMPGCESIRQAARDTVETIEGEAEDDREIADY